jgi:UDP-N-acetylmuramyl tripeptide synthase
LHVTDDNPRTEDPASIRASIIAECPNAIEVPSRYDAIKLGMSLAKENNYICIIAGKGHETMQDYGGCKKYFSDEGVVGGFRAERYIRLIDLKV